MELKSNDTAGSLSFNIYLNFDLLFESKFVYYSIIRFVNENLNVKEDLSLSWLQKLDFSNLDEFVSHFDSFDKETLKRLVKEKAQDAELIKTIKPKLFFLHKIANTIAFLNNFSFYLRKQRNEQADNKSVFSLRVLFNPDFLVEQFIQGAGSEILNEIKKILFEYLNKHFIGSAGEALIEINAEFLERREENINKCFSSSEDNEKQVNLVFDFQLESFVTSLLNGNGSNLIKIPNVLFLYKSLPKSDKTLDLELIRNSVRKALGFSNENNSNNNQNSHDINKINNFSDNLIKLITTDESEFLKHLMTILINLNVNKTFSFKSLFDEDYFAAPAEIDLQSLLEHTRQVYFQSKQIEEIFKDSNLSESLIKTPNGAYTIQIHKLFEASKQNFFADAFLNFNNFTEFIFKYNNSYLTYQFSYLNTWNIKTNLKQPITIQGLVTHGLKRGSKLLGIPTANLTPFDPMLIKNLINGVYYGDFIFMENKDNNPNIVLGKKYKGVLSIGYNPQFDNREKSVEVFLIDFEGEDFYEYQVSLNILGYIRTEAAFENFQELVTSISYDIIVANGLF